MKEKIKKIWKRQKKQWEREKKKIKRKKRDMLHMIMSQCPMVTWAKSPVHFHAIVILSLRENSRCVNHMEILCPVALDMDVKNTVRTQIRSWPDNEDRQDSGFIWFARERSRNSDFTEKKILKNVYYYK